MKGYASFFVISVMTLGLVFLLVTRERSKHEAPAQVAEIMADGGADAAADASALGDAGIALAIDAGAKPAERPLRVATLGWELASAGAAMTPPAPGAPALELAPETALDLLEARLARGGSDPLGADVAVLPLPAFVAAYDKLRALEPRAFLVVGFSHGREAVHAAPNALLKPPPAADEVKLVALGPATATDANARAAGSESATLLGLFALDLLGVAPSRVRLVAAGTPDAKAATLAAIVKGAADERKVGFSTADASRLVPIVAVAPRAVLEGRDAALREWSKAWLEGWKRAGKDIPGVARRLASKESIPLAAGVGGAPEALVLVERLGQLEDTGLDAQTTLIGPVAKLPVTLEVLMSRTWQLARAGGMTGNAAPDPLPIDARIVSMIAPPPPAPKTDPSAGTDADAGAPTFAPAPAGAVPLVSYRAVDGDADKVSAQIAFLAGVFERAVFKITAKGGEKAARAIASAARDRGVSATRLATGPADPGIIAVVDVLAPP